MGFIFSNANIRENNIVFIYEESAYPGVRKIAGRVREDIEKVFGAKPAKVHSENFRDTAGSFSYPVFFGTVGKSEMLDKLTASKVINPVGIADEREVYSITVVDDLEIDSFKFESAVIIAGSDKRGTIYGLFSLSEMLGVSPFVDWLDVSPQRLDELTLTVADSYISKTPSVKYRGFFINDEWPAFGNYCDKNFGGFNSKAYGHIFELLLRLKGNYLWPAMWTSVFSEDGPGGSNCELADELGVIMGTSHHEPCMRQGEEYSHVRGPGSVYGDAWDFRTNREGIIKFWEDGIRKRACYENVYTVGMRGEADSAIMGSESTVADNIALLRDVLKTQNRLLEEGVGLPAGKIPRLFALYKEVEPFFLGDDKTPGLMDDPALEGVTLLLCDDNYGNLRSVPTDEMRGHKGGYGMYYHFDYHGAPVSYEWFNTNYLPKVWDQMTQAYDCGIRELWIVNVGDIFTHEYPLGFFMNLAYDFERWGTSNRDSAFIYTKQFTADLFPGIDDEDQKRAAKLLLGYTRITSRRRTEAMNDNVYAPFAYGESERTLNEIEDLMENASLIYDTIGKDSSFAFYETVYLPLTATLNIQKMWLLTGLNHAYAAMGSTYANTLAMQITSCLRKDRKIVDSLHSAHKGKWYGMGLSEHIGFKHWCSEECQKPVVHTFEPAEGKRLVVSISSSGEHSEGGYWSGKTLTMADALNPLVCGGLIELSCASDKKAHYTISSEDAFIDVTDKSGSIKSGQLKKVFIFVDRLKMDTEFAVGNVTVRSGEKCINIRVPVYNPAVTEEVKPGTFIYCEDTGSTYMNCLSMGAADFASKNDSPKGYFEIIKGLGRQGAAIRAYPQDRIFTMADTPTVTYRFVLNDKGRMNVRVYLAPANPGSRDGELKFAIGANGEPLREVETIPDGFAIKDHNPAWEKGVLDNVRCTDVIIDFKEGVNELVIGAISLGFVLEKIVISKEGCLLPYSYLGPPTSFRVPYKDEED